MPNDLPMLEWAGTAYAMANAHRDVLEAVELKTSSNDEDGVAQVLEQLFG
jgi:hydroxymethylpyrimidine pyrophosphatase-like HAD family hydrolase